MTGRLEEMRHSLVYSYPVPSGWRGMCACGDSTRGVTKLDMLEAHARHVDEVSGRRRPVPGQDDGDRLIAAWLHWEDRPASRGACLEVRDAIRALGLSPTATHERVADARRRGLSVPDAVQEILNEVTLVTTRKVDT